MLGLLGLLPFLVLINIILMMIDKDQDGPDS
jgi:hypothetical protein